jgi:arylsulfatase A
MNAQSRIKSPTPNNLLGTLLHRFATLILTLLPAILSLCTVNTGVCDDKKSVPNIVLILADDMGYGDLGIQNPASKIPTPNLDKLAQQGMRFTDAHSSSGVCTPSRYALLQGRYHWRKFHGIVNSFDQPILDSERTTLPEMLKAKGYRTACIGKWHLGWDWNSIKQPNAKPNPKTGFPVSAFDWQKAIPGGPLSHGFDYYYGDDVPNFPPYAWFENDRVITPPTVPLATPKTTAEGNWEARPGPSVQDWDFWSVMPTLTEKAEAFIAEQSAEKPFFLYFPFTSPHAPIVPTEEFKGSSQANGFGDFMTQTDATVGRVLAALKKHGFSENTLVIFSADNGPEHYAYERLKNYGHRSMGPLRGLKRDIWEGGHRVPFIVQWPGKVPAGSVNHGLVSHMDIYATIAAIVESKIAVGDAQDSLNQLNCWQGQQPSVRTSLVHNTNPKGYAIRQGDWVLVAAKTGAVSKVPDWFNTENGYTENSHAGELYNLKVDLAQKKNLYGEHPEKVAELTQLLKRIQAEGIAP